MLWIPALDVGLGLVCARLDPLALLQQLCQLSAVVLLLCLTWCLTCCLLWLFCFCFLQCAELGGTCGGTQQQPNKNQWSCVLLSGGVSFPVALSRVRLCAFCIEVFCWSLGSIVVFCIGACILGLGHIYLLIGFYLLCISVIGSMPHGKGSQQSTRKNPREESGREDEFELEIDPTAREDTLSPLYSASTAGSASASSAVSSSQLEMILKSMEASQKSMESSFLSALSTISTSTSVAPSVASAPPPAVAPSSAVKVPKWTDGDQPFPFFTKLETAFTHNKVDKATWGRLLPVYLSGRAEIAFTQVDSSLLGDYDAVKSVLLKALGDTPAHAERHWWSLARLSGETPADFFSRVRHTGLRRLSQLPTREAVVDHVILSRFLSLLPADSYAAVMSQHPKTGLEAAEFLLDFEETRAYSRKRQPWMDHHHHPRREPHRSHSPNNSSSGNSNGGTSSSNSSSGSGAQEVTDGNPSAGAPASGSSRHSGGKSDRGYRKQVICHNCGEPGHIRPNCPNRIRSVRAPGSAPVIEVTGLIAGVPVKGLQIDTGAGRTVIDAKHIPRSAYLGKSITLDTWKGRQYSEHKLAKLSIVINGVSTVAVVAVAEDFGCPALLGLDLGPAMSAKITGIVADRTKAALTISESEVPMQVVIDEVPMQVVINEVPMQVVNDVVPMQNVKVEVPMQIEPEVACEAPTVALEEIFCFSDSLFEPEVACVAPAVALGEIFCFSDSLFEPEVACVAPAVALGEIFCFSDTLFEPEVACDAPAVAIDGTFCLSVCPFEPEEAGDASVVALEDIFWPDLGEVEFPLPDLDDDVLEASVAPACSDTFVVPRQLTEVKDEVLEVLEASVAPVCCTNIVVPRHLEEVKDEVLEAGVASVDSDKIVVPMQQVVVKVDLAVDRVAPADAVSDAVSDTVCDNFNLPEEFFVEDQADVVASGPVDCKPMVGLCVSDFVDSLSETDPVLASVPVARPEPEKVVIVVILAMKDSIPPKLCWQSPTVLVDHCLRCYTKATGKFAPGSRAVILVFDMFILVISAICSFCSCISMCLSKFLVVLFFGAFGPRAVPFWRMRGAPSVSWILDWLGCSLLPMRASLLFFSPCLRQQRRGEMLWSLPPSTCSSLTFPVMTTVMTDEHSHPH